MGVGLGDWDHYSWRCRYVFVSGIRFRWSSMTLDYRLRFNFNFKIMNRGIKGHSKSSISLKLSTEHLKDKDQNRSTLLNEDLLRRIRDDFVQLLTLVVNELTCVKKHGGRARVSTVTAPSESQLKGTSVTSTGSVTSKQPATLPLESDVDQPVFEDINEESFEKYCEDIQKFVQAYTIQGMTHTHLTSSGSIFKQCILIHNVIVHHSKVQ